MDGGSGIGVQFVGENTHLLRASGNLEINETNATTEKVNGSANAALCVASFCTGAVYASLRKGWYVVGATAAASTDMFAFARLNMSESSRKVTFFMLAGVTYMLFLSLYTPAQANCKSQWAQYLPIFALAVFGATFLELSTQGGVKVWNQINASKATPTNRNDTPLFGPWPMTRETLKYCAVQIVPAVAGAGLIASGVTLGSEDDGSKFLMLSNGILLTAGSVGRIVQNLFINFSLRPGMMKAEDDDVAYPLQTKRMIALNEGVQWLASVAAPTTFAIALTTDNAGVQCGLQAATGILNGLLDAEGQRRLEEDALRPPNKMSVSDKYYVDRVSWAVWGVFGAAMASWLVYKSVQTDNNPSVNHPATWGATGGIIGITASTFAYTKLIKHFWKNAHERGSLIWLSRLFGAESTRWLAYPAATFVHTGNMKNVVPSLSVVMASLLLSAATIGLDMALLNDDLLVNMRLSAFAWVMAMRYGATVPGSFPLSFSNSTFCG